MRTPKPTSGRARSSQRGSTLTLEEQAATVAWLEGLQHANGRPAWAWKEELQAAVGSTPVLRRMAEVLNGIDAGDPMEPGSSDAEDALENFAATALRIVGSVPVSSLGEPFERRIQDAVDKALVSRLWWAAAVVLAALVGGVTYGGFRMDSLLTRAQNAEATLEHKLETSEATIKADAQAADSHVAAIAAQRTKAANDTAQMQAQTASLAPKLATVSRQLTETDTGLKAAQVRLTSLKSDIASVEKVRPLLDATNKSVGLIAGKPQPVRDSFLWLGLQVYWIQAIAAGLSIVAVAVSFLAWFRAGKAQGRHG